MEVVCVASLLIVKQGIDERMNVSDRYLANSNSHELKRSYKSSAEFPVSDDVFIAGYPTSVVQKALHIVTEVQCALERGESFEVKLAEKRKK